jgi:hypothetical protein
MPGISANLNKNIPPVIERVAKLIAAFTGEKINNLVNKPLNELFQMLSTILQCDKEFVQSLFSEHDQNVELDENAIKALWKLLAKGVVKKRENVLGTLTKEQLKNIEFLHFELLKTLNKFITNSLEPSSTKISAVHMPNFNAKMILENKEILSTQKSQALLKSVNTNNDISLIAKK